MYTVLDGINGYTVNSASGNNVLDGDLFSELHYSICEQVTPGVMVGMV